MLARLQMVVVALLFSTGGAAIKATSLDAWLVAGGRSAVAALLIFWAVPTARRSWTWRIFGCGLAYAATLVLFVHANRLTTATAAVFLQATAPLYVVLAGPSLLGERLRRRDAVLIVGLVTALVLLLASGERTQLSAPAPALGAVLAALSAVTYAVVVLGLRSLQRSNVSSGVVGAAADGPGPPKSDDAAEHGGARAVLCGNVLAVALCALFAVPSQVGGGTPGLPPTLVDVGVVLYLGIFQVGLAYLLMLRASRSLRALEISLLLLIEPLGSPFWAWLVHRESASAGVWLGGGVALMTLLAHALLSTADGRRPARRL